MLNRFEGIGRVGRDPESKFTPAGVMKCTFSVAMGEKFKDKSGEMQERTLWMNVICWSKLGETMANNLKKGTLVFFEGRLDVRDYENKDGIKCKAVEVIASNVRFLSAKQGSSDAADGAAPAGAEAAAGDDDQIPF